MAGTEAVEQADLVRAADGFVRKTYRPNDLVAAVVANSLPLVG
jgi:hypothetical protein